MHVSVGLFIILVYAVAFSVLAFVGIIRKQPAFMNYFIHAPKYLWFYPFCCTLIGFASETYGFIVNVMLSFYVRFYHYSSFCN